LRNVTANYPGCHWIITGAQLFAFVLQCFIEQ